MSKALPKRIMTNWYNPLVLVPTAIRVVISTIFGELADRREAIAASNAIAPQPFDGSFDYSNEKGDFWFDFMADTGDGWNSTYAMARLISAGSLQPRGCKEPLSRGRLLVLGGDQVYPTASREAYDERFLAPFEQAYEPANGKPAWRRGSLDLLVVPGNHDWYDGLNSFFSLFCRRRVKPNSGIGSDRPGRIIAGRSTHQTRSYFAAKLPGGWWLWASDSQLEGYIDEPQIEYFRHVAETWMAPGSKLILCVAQPSWAYVDEQDPRPAFTNFSYLERIAGAAKDASGNSLRHELKLVLTGDSHHYSRFEEDRRQYVTCGGGGAFLHPTHQLASRFFSWDYPPPGQNYRHGSAYKRGFKLAQMPSGQPAIYPSRGDSWRLTFWNLAFPVLNRWFTATLALGYGLFDWLLDFNARLAAHETLGDVLGAGSFGDAIANYWKLVVISPAGAMMILVALGAYYYAADARNGWPRLLMGGLHALAQASVVTVTTCAVMRMLPGVSSIWQVAAAAVSAAILSSATYGLYLLVSLLGFKRHWNEAFSSFAHRGYKCMLRMRIAPDGKLSIFPIGLKKVPFDRRETPRNPPLDPHLIEPPIVLQ